MGIDLIKSIIIVSFLCMIGVSPVKAQESNSDPYADSIQEAIHDMGQQVSGTGPPPFQEADTRFQIHIVSADTGEELKIFQVQFMAMDPSMFFPATGHLFEFISPSWKKYRDVTGAVLIEGLPKSNWLLQIYSPGYIRYSKKVTIPYDEILEIALEPKAARLNGRIIDAMSSNSISGAKIQIMYKVGISTQPDPDFHPVITGEDGSFLLESLTGEGYKNELSISHGSYFRKIQIIEASAPWKNNLGDILLYPHAGILGQVVDSSGQPVDGQSLYVLHEDIAYQDPQAVAQFFSRKYGEDPKAMRYETDANGRFTTIPMHGGQYRVVYGNIDREVQLIGLEYGEEKTVILKKEAEDK